MHNWRFFSVFDYSIIQWLIKQKSQIMHLNYSVSCCTADTNTCDQRAATLVYQTPLSLHLTSLKCDRSQLPSEYDAQLLLQWLI
jgi:hypothetical protein